MQLFSQQKYLECSTCSYNGFSFYLHVFLHMYVSEDKRANQTLTSDLKLTVLSGAEHRVSQTKPRQLFAELRQEIVCDEAYNSSQDV